jgi:malate dehydrogenase
VTAGLPRKPGETREDLLKKNAEILKSVSNAITQHAPGAVVIVVTNPLDVMTLYLLEATGFQHNRVFGMGITLDASRFANLISEELKIPVSSISPCVIGSHGEGMMPLARLTSVKGVAVDKIMDDKKISVLVERTLDRGKEIVGLFGSGSAFAAPSAAIAELVKAVIKDEKRILGVSAYLTGQYGIRDICIGVPCCIGKSGIERIVELDLNDQEKAELARAASKIQEQARTII